jgi:lipopolysaccharide/colanic/teichoic acid biosynthesis glycosyltransferase
MRRPLRNDNVHAARAVHPAAKRGFDILLASLLLIGVSPVLCAVAAIIRLCMRGPVLFRQERAGCKERLFRVLKFRTMRHATDSAGRPLPDAERLTGLGRFLRKTSIDELPELWNVLRGEMSLVGPRPLLPEYLPRYNERQRRRHEVRPGITGWAQVNGRNALSWEEKLDLDVWYVDNRNLLLDLKILWMTLFLVLRRKGISQEGHATMAEFMGSRQGSGVA